MVSVTKSSAVKTIFTIAKRYGLEEAAAQVIVDYPFNDFVNDETFEVAVVSLRCMVT